MLLVLQLLSLVIAAIGKSASSPAHPVDDIARDEDATRRLLHGVGAQTTGGQAENPFVIARDGTYWLLFSDWHDPEDSCSVRDPRTLVQYATAQRLEADAQGSAHWVYRGATPDPGVNAIEVQRLDNGVWLMTQSVSNPNSCDERLHRRELRLRRMVWGEAGSFTTELISRPLRNTCAGCDS